jgi:hypothetical protein
MATNQQPAAGNNMAAMLGNMRPQPGQPGTLANYGAGMQAPIPAMGGPYNMPGQTPYQFGGGGTPQPMQGAGPGGFDPRAIAANPGGFQQWQQGAQQQEAARPGSTMLGQRPMPSMGAPGAGAPGKGAAGQNPQLKQAIAGLQGGPPMQRSGMMGGPMGPVRRLPRQPMQGVQPAMGPQR